MSPYAACLGNGQKRCRGRARLPKSRIKRYSFEVVKYVATTRRWYDRGGPRDAGAATPAKVERKGSGKLPFISIGSH